MDEIGPVDYMIVAFPGNEQFRGEIDYLLIATTFSPRPAHDRGSAIRGVRDQRTKPKRDGRRLPSRVGDVAC